MAGVAGMAGVVAARLLRWWRRQRPPRPRRPRLLRAHRVPGPRHRRQRRARCAARAGRAAARVRRRQWWGQGWQRRRPARHRRRRRRRPQQQAAVRVPPWRASPGVVSANTQQGLLPGPRIVRRSPLNVCEIPTPLSTAGAFRRPPASLRTHDVALAAEPCEKLRWRLPRFVSSSSYFPRAPTHTRLDTPPRRQRTSAPASALAPGALVPVAVVEAAATLWRRACDAPAAATPPGAAADEPASRLIERIDSGAPALAAGSVDGQEDGSITAAARMMEGRSRIARALACTVLLRGVIFASSHPFCAPHSRVGHPRARMMMASGVRVGGLSSSWPDASHVPVHGIHSTVPQGAAHSDSTSDSTLMPTAGEPRQRWPPCCCCACWAASGYLGTRRGCGGDCNGAARSGAEGGGRSGWRHGGRRAECHWQCRRQIATRIHAKPRASESLPQSRYPRRPRPMAGDRSGACSGSRAAGQQPEEPRRDAMAGRSRTARCRSRAGRQRREAGRSSARCRSRAARQEKRRAAC